MNFPTRGILFGLFFLSGFSSLVYQVIWTRLAFASFGIITPVLSVVLSVFMLGLALGSWAGGRCIPWLTRRTGRSAAMFYALVEVIIGLSAFAVPRCFSAGEQLLLAAGETNSVRYLLLSALVLGVAILPWCICMGATFPFMMAYVREQEQGDVGAFSFLYLANVLGAMMGTLTTALVLIEVFGFHQSLRLAAMANFIIALAALGLAIQSKPEEPPASTPSASPGNQKSGRPAMASSPTPALVPNRQIAVILFTTGFCAMAMEVVWTRAFTPTLKTQVYSFALIVFTYLGATFLGSCWYRRDLRRQAAKSVAALMAFAAMTVLLPIAACDPRWVYMDWFPIVHPRATFEVLASLCPFCAVLGYLTPRLIDESAGGNPTVAGRIYAINVVGCILGPLIASYVILPQMGERAALILLSLPLFGFYLSRRPSLPARLRWVSGGVTAALAVYSVFFAHGLTDLIARNSPTVEVRRDYAATVIAADPPTGKMLLVNGIGMTKLTPITKFMVHLPMAFHEGPPQSALIICFGMGTSYRSALSWNIPVTAVELVPDVPKSFGFYHPDAADVLQNFRGRIVIDDGRRFLKRTQEKFDIIVIDPPPPVEAAGCSLLYSTEFYALVKEHLNPGGILQAWFPGGDKVAAQAFFRSLYDSFPYVRCFPSLEGWGIHTLASLSPIEKLNSGQLAAKMPASAKIDLLEWSHTNDPAAYLDRVLSQEGPIENVLSPDPAIRITDDDPFNEYFLLRRMGLF